MGAVYVRTARFVLNQTSESAVFVVVWAGFEGTDVIWVVCSLSEFDQIMFEDATINRMHESLDVWENLCNSRFFTRFEDNPTYNRVAQIYLVLTKIDVFRAKLASPDGRYRLQKTFPSYTPPDQNAHTVGSISVAEHALRFVIDQFRARIQLRRELALKHMRDLPIFVAVINALSAEDVNALAVHSLVADFHARTLRPVPDALRFDFISRLS